MVSGVVGATSVDQYDERSCRQDPKVIGTTRQTDGNYDRAEPVAGAEAPLLDFDPAKPLPPGPATFLADYDSDDPRWTAQLQLFDFVYETCDGFLPW
jgi:hypothetical protein